jgi:hypothetical protein
LNGARWLALALDHFDVIHAALDRAGASGHGQAAGDGVEVLFQSLGERRDARQARAAGGGDPLRQVLTGELGEHDGERADLAAGGLQFGAAVQDRLEPGLLVLGQGAGAAGEPVGDVADLAEQAGEAAVALARVLVEVGLERAELAGARCRPPAVGEFLPGGGAVVALDGVQSPAQVPGDLPQAASLGPQGVD